MTREWQLIETGPKDHRVVLMFARVHGRHVYGTGYWFEGEDGSSGWIAHSFHTIPDTFRGSFDPTHWMPLPEPPNAKARVLDSNEWITTWHEAEIARGDVVITGVIIGRGQAAAELDVSHLQVAVPVQKGERVSVRLVARNRRGRETEVAQVKLKRRARGRPRVVTLE